MPRKSKADREREDIDRIDQLVMLDARGPTADAWERIKARIGSLERDLVRYRQLRDEWQERASIEAAKARDIAAMSNAFNARGRSRAR